MYRLFVLIDYTKCRTREGWVLKNCIFGRGRHCTELLEIVTGIAPASWLMDFDGLSVPLSVPTRTFLSSFGVRLDLCKSSKGSNVRGPQVHLPNFTLNFKSRLALRFSNAFGYSWASNKDCCCYVHTYDSRVATLYLYWDECSVLNAYTLGSHSIRNILLTNDSFSCWWTGSKITGNCWVCFDGRTLTLRRIHIHVHGNFIRCLLIQK